MNTAPVASNEDGAARRTLMFTITVGCLVIALMMVVGAAMRASQATYISLGANEFYRLMTLHGAGMIGAAGLAGAMVMWTFLRKYVSLSTFVFQLLLALTLAGVVLIVGSIVIGNFAAGWTFLYPLPAKSMGMWSVGSATAFTLGLTLIGVGFLLFYADAAIAINGRYGSLWRGIGGPQLFSGRVDEAPAPTVIASTMVIAINMVGILVGAVVLVMTLVNLWLPDMAFDALLMKNLIYLFGHTFINAAIYMAVITVYEVMPKYTGRPWKVSRTFIAAWLCGVFLVTSVYPHHLLMDGAMPKWALALGQIVSFLSGIPVLLVTAWGLLANISRSGLKWDMPAALLVLGVAGWSAGVIPAIVDGTIVVNHVMHNTLWVPGHFHTYLLLGFLPMIFAFLLYTVRVSGRINAMDRVSFWTFLLGGAVFCLTFLYSGSRGAPRRFSDHAEQWIAATGVGSLASVFVLIAAVWFVIRILTSISRTSMDPSK